MPIKLILIALILTTQSAMAFELNGKKWVEDKTTIMLPKIYNTELMRKRMSIIGKQFNKNTPFKVKGRYHDLRYDTLTDVINFASEHNVIVVLHENGETFGLGNRVANCGFVASQGSTEVHAGVIRINDVRFKEVTAGASPTYALNYLANVVGHEIGHKFGLGHENQSDFKRHRRPIMTIGKFSKFKNLGLAPDDKKGLREIYK